MDRTDMSDLCKNCCC